MLAQVSNQVTIIQIQNENYPDELEFNKHVRDTETKIFIRNNNVRDCVMIDSGLNDNVIKSFPFVKINLLAEIKEYRTSSDLFNGVEIENKDGYPVKTWELKRHHGDYEYYSIQVDNLNSSQFYMGNGIFKIKLKYYCLQNHHFQDWYLRNVHLNFTLKSN